MGTAHAGDPRFPPPEVRSKVVGCWQLATHQKLVITEFGKHDVQARLEGAVTTELAYAPWRPQERSFTVARCDRAQGEHNACQVAPEAGQLHLRVLEAATQATAPKLVADVVIPACRD